MTEQTYIREGYKLTSGKPTIVDGIIFRPYRTGISIYARISDDGKIFVADFNHCHTTYYACVIGHGPIQNSTGKIKRFRDQQRAFAEAVKVFKKLNG